MLIVNIMKLNLSSFVTGLFLISSLIICAQGNETFEAKKAYDGIKVFGPFAVELVEGMDAGQVEITYKNIDRNQFVVSEEEGLLYFRIKTAKVKDVVVNIKLSSMGIKRIQAGAGGAVFSNDVLYADMLVVKINSGASVEMQVSVGDLDLKVSQGGECHFRGDAKSVNINADTGGFLNLADLEAGNWLVEADTGAEVKIKGGGVMKLNASTAGNIEYKGVPKEVSISTSLGGEISKVE
ncbi:MAG: hypothetical protein ACJAY8_001052 [Sphingobacteriales bacterium]|jgi:hypothetical protein